MHKFRIKMHQVSLLKTSKEKVVSKLSAYLHRAQDSMRRGKTKGIKDRARQHDKTLERSK